MFRQPRAVVLIAIAAMSSALASVQRTSAAEGAVPVPSPNGVASEDLISASANPNLTPFLFAEDTTESLEIYAKSQAYAAENSSACGGAVPAEQGGCCPFSPSDGACDDHDPASTGCADASSFTVTESNITDASGAVIGLVEVRYSPTCQTNWGRVTGFGAYASALKQTTACRGTPAQYSDSGCTDTDTGLEPTRFSDQVFAPTECVSVVGVLIQSSLPGARKVSATTPPAC